jgi:hypothetical protein
MQINVTYCQDSVRPRPIGGGGGEPCGALAFLTPLKSLTGPVGQPFASCLGGSGSRPRDAPTVLELGSPVSNVSLHNDIKYCRLGGLHTVR